MKKTTIVEADREKGAREWVRDYFSFVDSKFTSKQWEALMNRMRSHMEDSRGIAMATPSSMTRIEAFRKHQSLTQNELDALKQSKILPDRGASLKNEFGDTNNFAERLQPSVVNDMRRMLSLGEYPPDLDEIFYYVEPLLFLLKSGALMRAFEKMGFSSVKKYLEYAIKYDRYKKADDRIREELSRKYGEKSAENQWLIPELLLKCAPQLLTDKQQKTLGRIKEFKDANELNVENFLRKLLVALADEGLECYFLTS